VGKFRRQLNFESEVRAFFIQRQDGRGAIDMTLDEMTAESVAGAEGELKVYATLWLEILEIRPRERFLQNVES
jgi:hypothetical protein